jgi:hypothetical protein
MIRRLVKAAVDNGVLYYVAYTSALKYVLENESPEYLLLLDNPAIPMKGYMKCIRLWRDIGLIRPISRREAVIRVINSRMFGDTLIENGVPISLLDSIRERLLNRLKGMILRDSLKNIIDQIVDRAITEARIHG